MESDRDGRSLSLPANGSAAVFPILASELMTR
jgi:hypothetical protein